MHHRTSMQGRIVLLRLRSFCFLSAMVIAPLRPSFAQAARPGRLPVLATFEAKDASCIPEAVSDDLQKLGVVSLVSVTDSAHRRLASLAFASDYHPRMLYSSMSTRSGRRIEGESVTIFLANDGKIARGERRARTGGIPASSSEDRAQGLLPEDSSAALMLISSISNLCGPVMHNSP
jgi:hypothetical protein